MKFGPQSTAACKGGCGAQTDPNTEICPDCWSKLTPAEQADFQSVYRAYQRSPELTRQIHFLRYRAAKLIAAAQIQERRLTVERVRRDATDPASTAA